MTDDNELERVRQLSDQQASGEPPTEGEVLPLQPPAPESDLSPEMRLMFGASFNPQPFGYVITRGEMHGASCLYLTFEYGHGRVSFPLSDLEAQGLANRLNQQARGGLVVAKDMPT